MGNTESRKIGFSNSTPYTVKFMVHEDIRLIIKSDTEKSLGAKVSSKAGVKAPGGIGVEAEKSFEFEYRYRNQEEAAHHLVDPNFEGFITVGSNNRLDLSNNPIVNSADGKKKIYVSVIVFYPDGSVDVHLTNYCVNNNCNWMLGMTESKKLEFVALGPTRTWRANREDGTQNYYYRRVCNGCGEIVSCKRDCSDLAEFGGHRQRF